MLYHYFHLKDERNGIVSDAPSFSLVQVPYAAPTRTECISFQIIIRPWDGYHVQRTVDSLHGTTPMIDVT